MNLLEDLKRLKSNFSSTLGFLLQRDDNDAVEINDVDVDVDVDAGFGNEESPKKLFVSYFEDYFSCFVDCYLVPGQVMACVLEESQSSQSLPLNFPSTTLSSPVAVEKTTPLVEERNSTTVKTIAVVSRSSSNRSNENNTTSTSAMKVVYIIYNVVRAAV